VIRGLVVETDVTLLDHGGDGAGQARAGFHLLIMSPDAFVTVPLPEAGEVSIGRASDAVVRIEDLLASRRHAVLHVGAPFQIEDAGSANGTRVRDERLTPKARVAIEPGEAIVIGSTVLMVQQNRAVTGMRRLWSHSAFEGRLEDECARAAATGGSFALGRFQIDRAAPLPRVLPVFARELPQPHGLAAYGPHDYEVLFVEAPPPETTRLVDVLLAGLRGAGVGVKAGVAWYPRDGRSAQALLARANALLRPVRQKSDGEGHASEVPIATCPEMDRVRELAGRAAGSNINVLILGETGVGKEVLARAVHRQSARHAKPFVPLNCAGLTESLIESELFGHEKGAFTGAGVAKMGLLESAAGGTVFLDEIGEMPLGVQARLLRVIETREVLPVGGVRPRPIDVRFVAATNRDLERAVLEGGFRRDLFFRLNGISLTIPPLRERLGEIAGLAQVFVEQACRDAGRPPPLLPPLVLQMLRAYRWPGNIRELKNVIERALVLCDGDSLDLAHLPVDRMSPAAHVVVPLPAGGEPPSASTPAPPGEDSRVTLQRFSGEEEAERQRILQALSENAGNQTRAARALGMPRRTFVTRLDRYSIHRPRK
jgi:two-component system response regulator AtoC